MISQPGVSVVAVNSHNCPPNKNVPSLFKRLFSRDSIIKQQRYNGVMPHNLASSNLQNTPTTLLQLNQLTPNKLHVIHDANGETNLATMTDLCSKCHLSPPQISVVNSRGMTAEKLCSGCHILSQQPMKGRAQEVEEVRKFKCDVEDVVNSRKTVIVMQGNGMVSGGGVARKEPQRGEDVLANRVAVGLQNHSTFLNEKPEPPKEQVQMSNDKPQVSKLSFQPSFRKGDKRPNFEGRIVLVDTVCSPISEFLGPSLNCLPGDGVLGSNISFLNPCDSDDDHYNSVHQIQNSSSNFPLNHLGPDRPLAFNPDYRGTHHSAGLELPPELEAPSMRQFSSKFEEAMHADPLHHQPISAPDEGSFPMAPPRYEDIMKAHRCESLLDSYPLQLIKSFGKPCSQLQPGGFNQPSFLKFSPHQSSSDGILVVTDPPLNSLQVFDSAGKCLAMVRIGGVVCGCATTNNTLLAACEDKLALYRYDGSEKASMGVVTSNRNEVRSITRFKNNSSFAILAQRRLVSVIDCSFQKVSVVEAFQAASDRKPFKNIADVAMTNKDDLVVLDAGDDDTSIFVMTTTTGQLKSAIFLKHESCGPLLSPCCLSLDQNNRIVVADAQQDRVLVISVSQKSTSRNTIVVRKLTGIGERQTPLGLDISPAGLFFILLKGEHGCVVSIFSV